MRDLNGWRLAASVGAVLALALYGLTVAGHFPVEHRAPAFKTRAGTLVLWATLLLAGASALVTLSALRTLSWPAAVIGSGGALLVAPLLLHYLPDRVVNGRRGLLVSAGLAAALASIACRLPT